MSLWVICKTLVVFVNELTAGNKYSLRNSENLLKPFQMQLSKKKNSQFLLHFWNLHQFLNILKKKTLIVYVFPKLQNAKDLVRPMSKMLLGSSFSSKCLKLDVDFRYGTKNSEEIIDYSNICNWIGFSKFSLLRREYLSPTVSVLTKSPKISFIIKRDIF